MRTESGIIITLILTCQWLLLHVLADDISHFCNVSQVFLGIPGGVSCLLINKSYLFFLLHFRFWGTCEEHARFLHRYTRGSVICCLPPLHLYLAFLPMLSLPNSPPRSVPPLFPPNRPKCVVLPSLCPCVLIVQHPPMSENMCCLIFCSCVSLLRMMVSRFIHVPTKDTNSSFLIAA